MTMMNEKAQAAVESAQSQLGNPYVFGAWGSECTPSMRQKYARLNPSHGENIRKKCRVLNGSAVSCDGCSWQGKLAFDCRGFTHWVFGRVGIQISGGGATTQYNTAGNWDARGTLDQMPDAVCCVFKQSGGKMQHTGVHIGGGKIIHCSNGVQTGRTTDRGWTHWAIPAGLYSPEELDGAQTVQAMPILRLGSRGDWVKQLQARLTALGYECGAADGIFGAKTQAAVKAFQAAMGLKVDGIAGDNTNAALAAAEQLAGGPDTQAEGAVAEQDAPGDAPGVQTAVNPSDQQERARAALAGLRAMLDGDGYSDLERAWLQLAAQVIEEGLTA